MAELTPIEEKFILHWGEMGNKWGINRTVAHIHALLLISAEPLNAEDIAAKLSVARSNVSTSIRELIGWEIIKTASVLGDRREYYTALGDPWEMFRIIAEKRKRREVDPTVEALRDCQLEMSESKNESPHTKARIKELLSFFETVTGCYEQVNKLPTPILIQLFKMKNPIEALSKLLKRN